MLNFGPFKLFLFIFYIRNNKNPPITDEVCWSLDIRYCGTELYVNNILQRSKVIQFSIKHFKITKMGYLKPDCRFRFPIKNEVKTTFFYLNAFLMKNYIICKFVANSQNIAIFYSNSWNLGLIMKNHQKVV